jgi:hypothetical protein
MMRVCAGISPSFNKLAAMFFQTGPLLSGEATDRSKPSDNGPTFSRVAPKTVRPRLPRRHRAIWANSFPYTGKNLHSL